MGLHQLRRCAVRPPLACFSTRVLANWFSSTETWPINGLLMYGKNVTCAFGRCPVRSIFEDALKLLVQEQKKVAFLCGVTRHLETAKEAYKEFEARKVHKIVFKMDEKEAGKKIEAN